ncbi:uncharacterized protein [Nicotiana sylvestris]|uniref:uncharacterized protein n=1 Tax=Nicotiana sylvestris TaxID=4096 RepID=UPI00388C5C7B
MELLKGRWEALNHGLPKDVAMRPPSGDEDVPPKSPALKHDDDKKIKRASVLHYEAFLRILEEHEAEVRELTKKRDVYKLRSEKFQAKLEVARGKNTEMAEQVFRVLHDSEDKLEITTNDPILQVDTIWAEAEEFKKNMDILASKKEAIQVELESAESQLRAAREKALVQVKKIEEFQSQLDSVIYDKANLANELEAAKSEVAMANTKVYAKVAQYKVDVEAIQVLAKRMADHAKWQARREALEEVHAWGFDILAELENAKAEEARSQKLAFSEEDSESLSESEGGEDPEGGDAAFDEDQAI